MDRRTLGFILIGLALILFGVSFWGHKRSKPTTPPLVMPSNNQRNIGDNSNQGNSGNNSNQGMNGDNQTGNGNTGLNNNNTSGNRDNNGEGNNSQTNEDNGNTGNKNNGSNERTPMMEPLGPEPLPPLGDAKLIIRNYTSNTCPFSKQFSPEWQKIDRYFAMHPQVRTEIIDCTFPDGPGIERARHTTVDHKVGVGGVPTVTVATPSGMETSLRINNESADQLISRALKLLTMLNERGESLDVLYDTKASLSNQDSLMQKVAQRMNFDGITPSRIPQ